MLKVEFLGAWHSHAARRGEVDLVAIMGKPLAVRDVLRELAACIRGEKTPDFALAHDRAVQQTLFKGCGITDGHALRT